MSNLSKIDTIRNLAVYSNYEWDQALETFKRYNLVYGWNGSGKTALSRLFDSFATGVHPMFPDLEYRVTVGGTQFTNKDAITTKVRVFNCDYVDRNVKVIDGHANPIYVLGEKSQEVLYEIKKDEDALNGIAGDESKPGKIELRRRAQSEHKQASKRLDEAFTNIASTISAAWGRAGAIRTYRRPDARKAFDILVSRSALSESELAACSQVLAQTTEPELALVAVQRIQVGGASLQLADALRQIEQRATSVLAEQIQNVAISRLTAFSDISRWVESGVELHGKHSSSLCEFCQQSLPPQRLSELANHFSEADKRLKRDIVDLLGFVTEVGSRLDSIRPYDEAKLYKALRKNYSTHVGTLERARAKLSDSLTHLVALLEEKKSQTTKAVHQDVHLDEVPFQAAIANTNSVLAQHNETASNLERAQDQARADIERHHLASIAARVEEQRSRIAELERALDVLDNGDPKVAGDLGITATRERITVNRAKVSSAHKSCRQLNETLKSFFGRDELSFEVESASDGQTVGYRLSRRGEVARNVSEGERTAIAFAHFTIQLTEQGFSLEEGIVVIDDPISSLDTAALYKVCAAIEKQLINAGQLFLLTHNMDFFNHMKKWFLNDPGISGGSDRNKADYRLLMIQNRIDTAAERRVALIADLDPMLRDYESEYHYLFKKLLSFDEDNPETQDLPMRAVYDYPNLARKLLECFLAYRVPTKGSFYVRLHGLKDIGEAIAGEDIKYVYNFVNTHSHLDTKTGVLQFDPSVALNGRDAIRKTLRLIESADKHHYKSMAKAVKKG